MINTITGELLQGSWSDFIGQTALKDRLQLHIAAAVNQDRMLDHVLLTGPPGFGKTTLAEIIANEMGDPFAALTMPLKPQSFAAFLRRWSGGVLLLDELHRASQSQQEDLLGLLDAGELRLPRGIVEVEQLTVIGATTERDKIIAPLYDRFTIKPAFADYSDDDMGTIVLLMADKIGLEMDVDIAIELGRATGGTPRNARQLVFAARDIASAGRSVNACDVLAICGMEPDGLSKEHVHFLRCLADQNGTASIKTVSSLLRLHPVTMSEIERLLLQRQLITITSSGRELTSAGFSRIKRHAAPLRRVV